MISSCAVLSPVVSTSSRTLILVSCPALGANSVRGMSFRSTRYSGDFARVSVIAATSISSGDLGSTHFGGGRARTRLFSEAGLGPDARDELGQTSHVRGAKG